MTIKAIYPGTFDPITNGHLEILNRSIKIFNHITIGVSHNIKKKLCFL